MPIPYYWLSTPEVSGADVAETSYRCFAGSGDAIDVRLVVRRVRPTPGSQLALFTAWGYHAFSSSPPGWRTCRPDGSWPTPPGSR